VAAKENHSCAVVSDGTVNTVWCWGSNVYGELGSVTSPQYKSVPVKVPFSTASAVVKSVVAGGNHSCALFSDGTVQCWGNNSYGQLGNGKTTDSDAPVVVLADPSNNTALTGVLAISAGFDHNCALLADAAGNRIVKCWGYGVDGELGNGISGTGISSSTPVTVILNITAKPPLTNVRSISAGGSQGEAQYPCEHTCAVLNDNTVNCWGCNKYGQLGNNSQVNSNLPVTVVSTSGQKLLASSVAAQAWSTCALLPNATVQCWGLNSYGQLGNGTPIDSTALVTVKLIGNAISLAAGVEDVCVVLDTGEIQCWGDNYFGELLQDPTNFTKCSINKDMPCSSVPIKVNFPNAAIDTQIAIGRDYISSLGSDGSLYSCGWGSVGQLGNGATDDVYDPLKGTVYTSWAP
jgi:alpha-tubulin suppressor-like RCC1 family protein